MLVQDFRNSVYQLLLVRAIYMQHLFYHHVSSLLVLKAFANSICLPISDFSQKHPSAGLRFFRSSLEIMKNARFPTYSFSMCAFRQESRPAAPTVNIKWLQINNISFLADKTPSPIAIHVAGPPAPYLPHH